MLDKKDQLEEKKDEVDAFFKRYFSKLPERRLCLARVSHKRGTDEASPGHHEHAIWRHSVTLAESRFSHSHAKCGLGAQLACQESRL